MITFRCTQAVRKLLGVADRDLADADSAPVSDWFVNVATFERKRCVLFTHAATLYSFWVAGIRRADRDDLFAAFCERLAQTMAADGFQSEEVHGLLREGHRFARTNSFSVLGSTNDFVRMTRFHIEHHRGLAPRRSPGRMRS